MNTIKITRLLLQSLTLCCLLQTAVAQTQAVCSISNLPSGWVVTDLRNCLCCGATGAIRRTQYTIKNIGNMATGSTVQVCSLQNIPPDGSPSARRNAFAVAPKAPTGRGRPLKNCEPISKVYKRPQPKSFEQSMYRRL